MKNDFVHIYHKLLFIKRFAPQYGANLSALCAEKTTTTGVPQGMQMVGAKVVFESECNQNEGSQTDKEQVSWILQTWVVQKKWNECSEFHYQ